MPLWVYLKSSRQLQYIITNQQERGRKGRRRQGGGKVVRSVLNCLFKKLTVKRWQGCRQVKDAPHGERAGERMPQEKVLSRDREGT